MISNNALEILNKRYFLKDKDGNVIEDWDKLCKRVSNAVAKDEPEKERDEWAKKYYDLIYNLKFLPNSPTLMNAGTPDGMLSGCFVLPIEDNMNSIMDAVKHAALVHKSGGGTGFSFGKLRPKNSIVKSTSGVASGPVSFMRMINGVTEEIKQGGRRRGANLGSLPVHHPDIIDFINCKKDTSKITNFNISITVTDEFMEAVKKDGEYDIIDPRTQKTIKRIKAKPVFDLIVNNAWESGEPGLLFIDRINRDNLYGTYETTNPCGEVPLLPYESCNLGSINLFCYVNEKGFDFEQLKKDVHIIVRFLDSIVSINNYPLEEIKTATLFTRKIGLGIMGLADAFIEMGTEYGDKNSIYLAENIMGYIKIEADKASVELATKKGESLVSQKLRKEKQSKTPIRNIQTTVIAPTGTISLIAGASSGCEPIFSVGYIRKVVGSKDMKIFNPLFLNALKENNIELTKDLEDKILSQNSIADIKEIPEKIRKLFKTAMDVSFEEHIKMQAALQKSVDGGISKTINLPNSATKSDVAKAYLLAYELKCKGITVYRDGSRPMQILSTKQEEKTSYRHRVKVTQGVTEKINTPLGKLYLTVNKNKQEDIDPVEVFIQIGKSGSDIKAYNEAVGRLISLCFKYKIPVKDIVKQLKGIKGEETIFCEGAKYGSIIDLVGRKLENYIIKDKEVEKMKCPECGTILILEERCAKCSCGYSKC